MFYVFLILACTVCCLKHSLAAILASGTHLVLLSALHMQKVISRTFETLRSNVKSESCVLTVCDSAVVIWPNKSVNADIHQWIQ